MLGNAKSLVIPGSGIDIEKFERAAAGGPTPSALRQVLGLNGAEVVITIARLNRQKGIPTLLEAAALVHRKRPKVRFLLVGSREREGSQAVPQAEIDRHAPYVMAVGHRSDVPSLLAAADAFAFPTELREGVPRVLLEAAIANVPIVATQTPGCTDVVHDGWTGFLVPPHSPEILAEKIIQVLSDRGAAQEMSRRCAEWVKREFNLDIIVARYAAVYESLLDGSIRAQSQAMNGANSLDAVHR
jgi:glycosyltransferase involved in cell wall biosynthesis